ncbi:MAG: hypothetical protein AAGF67_03025 [Verrucomicrobiota bacterium]
MEASPRIKESRLDRSKEDVREPLYTEWLDPNEVADYVAKKEGFPLYQEVNRRGESRVLLVKGLQRSRYYYYCLMSEESLIEKQEDLSEKGFTMITLSEDADGRFAATWVDSSKVDIFTSKMEELGIGMATYKD